MSTVLVFNPVPDLAGVQSALGEATLNWSAATRILELVNLGAELGNVGSSGTNNGPPVGWTDIAGSLRVRVNETGRAPPEGLNIFDGGAVVTSRASQRFSPLTYGLTIGQIDSDGLNIIVDWWGGTFQQSNNDQPKMLIHFYSAALSLLGSHDSGFKDPVTNVGSNMRWNQYQEVAEIPATTRFIDIELWANRRAGTNNDAAFDDIRISFEDGEPIPFVPGYAIYQDGVLVATAPANATEYVVSGLADGDYDFKIVAYDGTNFLSGDSNTVEVSIIPDTFPDVVNDIFLFDDEEIFTGYLGGKLRGKTVACPGRNANTARKCGG